MPPNLHNRKSAQSYSDSQESPHSGEHRGMSQ
jgi:hypothetical protein